MSAPTLTDVAKAAGVSVATASMVLNPGAKTNKVSVERTALVREAAARLGYVANYHARAMQVGRAETIGLALDFGSAGQAPSDETPMGGEYFHHLTVGIEAQTHFVGYNLALIGPGHQERAVDRGIRQILQRRLDALVVPGVLMRTAEAIQRLVKAQHLPIVLVEHDGAGTLPVVGYDEAEGVRRAVAHLAGLGHRDLLWLGPDGSGPQQREQFFMQAAKTAGLRGSTCRYAEPSGPASRTSTADAALAGLAVQLSKPRSFTGIVCYNDQTAVGAYGALMAAGLVIPRDVSVIGYDDFMAPYLVPRLTTVSHMLVQMGRRAAELALEIAATPDGVQRRAGHRELLVPELVVRASTAPPALGGTR